MAQNKDVEKRELLADSPIRNLLRQHLSEDCAEMSQIRNELRISAQELVVQDG
jgi:hypothetical protein